MAFDNYANFVRVTVASGFSSSATSATLVSGDVAKLPAPPFYLCCWNTDYGDPSLAPDDQREILRVTTAPVGSTISFARAQQGTTANNFNSVGKTYQMIAGIDAAFIAELTAQLAAINTNIGNLTGADTALDTRVDALEASDTAQSTAITNLEAADVALDLRVDALEAGENAALTHSPLDKLTNDRNYQKIIEAIEIPASGQRATIMTLTGEGIVRCFQFSLEGGEFGWNGILEIYIDGEAIPSISCDIGTLFLTHLESHTGTGGLFSTEHMSSQAMGSTRPIAVSAFTLFPMPYSTGFIAKFYNPGIPITPAAVYPMFFSNCVYSPGVTSNKRLRSVNRTLLNPVSVASAATVELFKITGIDGHLVWFSAAFTGATNYTYLERNYWLELDGETMSFTPEGKPIGSFVGDGTEDAPFLSGWYFLGRSSIQDHRILAVPVSNIASMNTVAGFDYLAAYGGVKFINSLALGFGTEPGCTTNHQMSYAALYYADISTPSVPMAPVISGVAGDGYVNITVRPPLSQGSSPVTGYAGTLNPGAVPLTLAAGLTTLNIPGLTNDTTYTIVLHAINAVGNSVDSNALELTPVAMDASELLTDLIAYWKLDEASGARADSHGTNDLLNDFNTVMSSPGIIGNSAFFNHLNSEFLGGGTNTAFQTGDIDFTFSIWFYLTAYPAVSESFIMIGKDVDTPALSRDYDIDIYTPAAGPSLARFYINGSGVVMVASPVAPSLNAWHHVIVWHDATGDTVNLQMDNGAVQSVSTGGVAPQASSAEFNMGARSYAGFAGFYNGLIDEVGFWKRLLTTDERTALYNAGAGLAYPFT